MTTTIRCSSLAGYCDCPRRAAARMFREEIEAAGFKLRRTRTGIGAIIGTAVHRGAEVALDEKARSGSLPPLSVSTDAAMTVIHEGMLDEVLFDGPRGATHSRRDAEFSVLSLTTTFYHVIAPPMQPLIVEKRFEATIAPGVVLSGQPDVICHEPNAVNDLKTSAHVAGTFAPQIGGYSLLARSHGIDIEVGRVHHLRRVGRLKRQPPPEVRELVMVDAESAASAICRHVITDLQTFRYGNDERRILAGDPWSFPANPQSLLCSPRFCPAFGTAFCREGDPEKDDRS